MIVYFTASVAAKKQFEKNYQAIIGILEKEGHEVIADHIMKVTEKDISLKTREDRIQFHEQLEKWIKSCDFMIAETSFPSISVGYEVSLALKLNVPVLILYSAGDPPSLLAHHENERLLCTKYNLETVKSDIKEFINYIEGKSDTRFTFFITPEIASFLEEISQKEKLPKSVYLRKLIKEDIKKRSHF